MQDVRPLLGALALTGPVAFAAEPPPPLFGDWWYIMPEGWTETMPTRGLDPCLAVPRFPYAAEPMYVPVNHTGGSHGGPMYDEDSYMGWYALCLAEQFDRLGAPVAVLIRNRNCPFPYASGGLNTTPDALPVALSALPKLDYVFMDLEPWGADGTTMMQMNAAEVHSLVRLSSNPGTAGAFIGNYGDWPGRRDEAAIWPGQRDRARYHEGQEPAWDRDRFYRDNFNIAMPSAYPYESYSVHADARFQGANRSPNDRAAIFWAPIERVSAAARNLPTGHVLIPWISNYVHSEGNPDFYHAAPPSWEDLEAMVQHLRLRGSTSYMLWTPDMGRTDHPTLDYESFRQLAMDAWTMLEPLFDSAAQIEFLNLDTEKTSGLTWSGARAGDRVWVLVSNLNEQTAQAARLPRISGLPETTPAVAPGEHMLFEYTVDPAIRDFDQDGSINRFDYYHFMTSVQNGGPMSGRVGGFGADAMDVDGSGLVDLVDMLAVMNAYRDGAYPAAPPSNGSRPAGNSAGASKPRSALTR